MLQTLETLGIEDVVSCKVGKDNARRVMADDEVAEDEQFLLTPEAGVP